MSTLSSTDLDAQTDPQSPFAVTDRFVDRHIGPSPAEIATMLRNELKPGPGAIVQTRVRGAVRSRGGNAFGDGRLSVEIRGHDPEVSKDLADRALKEMREANEVFHPYPTDTGPALERLAQKLGMFYVFAPTIEANPSLQATRCIITGHNHLPGSLRER